MRWLFSVAAAHVANLSLCGGDGPGSFRHALDEGLLSFMLLDGLSVWLSQHQQSPPKTVTQVSVDSREDGLLRSNYLTYEGISNTSTPPAQTKTPYPGYLSKLDRAVRQTCAHPFSTNTCISLIKQCCPGSYSPGLSLSHLRTLRAIRQACGHVHVTQRQNRFNQTPRTRSPSGGQWEEGMAG